MKTPPHESRQAVLLWSGGKDSALALHHARASHPDVRVTGLVTCLSQAYDRVSMHGVRRQLAQDQADALGLPIRFVIIPSPEASGGSAISTAPGADFPPDDVYSRVVLAALGELKREGVELVVCGDIFLEDVRAYRERLFAAAGLEGCYPLWGRDTGELFDEFVALGFGAVVVCVDTARLTEGHCGRLLTPDFRASLPEGVDPCGERGEYHTFAFDGPPFRRPVPFTPGALHRQAPFTFLELLPAAGDLHAADQAPA